jgi:sucrose-6-phosphate hydrolase SacC (GH32 family)
MQVQPSLRARLLSEPAAVLEEPAAVLEASLRQLIARAPVYFVQGLMWTKDASGNVTYHMYFQSSDPGQSLGSIWGHTTSPDLVHWQRVKRTMMRGSSGGGFALPAGFTPPAELAGAKAVIFSSVPMSPALNPPTGLHLSFSKDDALLEWTEYRNESSVQSSTNATCVICPDDVPPEYHPGYIGDNYAWVESSGDSHEFFVLSGSTRCAENHPWCSYQGIGGNSTAQAFVFRSLDLLHWELIANWDFLPKRDAWSAGVPHTAKSEWPGQRIDTPDTFALTNEATMEEEQVFVWLNSAGCATHWMLGSMDNKTKALTTTTNIGCADRGAAYRCQQSLTTPEGDRVSIAWVSSGGDGWDGAQSLPRVVTLDGSGVAYKPIPALASLHGDYHYWRHHTIDAGTTEALPDISAFGGHMHLVLVPHTTEAGKVTLSILGGACEIVFERLCEGGKPCPSEKTCKGSILNNSDTTGPGAKVKSVPANSSLTPEWCQEICCADKTCGGWTFADPQPGSNGSTYDCWTRPAGTKLISNMCGDGHCWAGLVDGASNGVWRLSVGGSVIGDVRPNTALLNLNAKSLSTEDNLQLSDEFAHAIEVFVDGELVEVYYGGEVVTQQYAKASSMNVTLSTGSGAPATVHLDAWPMASSVMGGPEE